MSSISLEAFDSNIRGKYSQWILPSNDFCALPYGFQDQILSGTPAIQTHILVMSKQDSKAWLISHNWDLVFTPDSMTEWSLLHSVTQHLKKPLLIVTAPKCTAPVAFWQKCLSSPSSPTCVSLRDIEPGNQSQQHSIPHSIFFPRLDKITDTQCIKIPTILATCIQQSIQSLDLRSLYRDLRGAGASLCLSLIDSRFATGASGNSIQQNGLIPSYNATWFYPENNTALRLHISDLRMILRTATERMAE